MLYVLGSRAGQAPIFIQSNINQKVSFDFNSKLLKIPYRYFLSLSQKKGDWILAGSEQKIGLLNPKVYQQVQQKKDKKNEEQ